MEAKWIPQSNIDNATRKRGHDALESTSQEEENIPKNKSGNKKDKKKKHGLNIEHQTKKSSTKNIDHFLQVDPNLLYNNLCRGPFIVFAKYQMGIRDAPKLSNLDCAQKLVNCNVIYTNAEPHGYNLWKLTFPNISSAKNAIRNKFLQDTGFTLYIPKYKLSRKGVIHQVPLDIPTDKLTSIIEKENPGIAVQEAYRKKIKLPTLG